MHPNRRQGRRPIVTLLQSSPNDTLGVRAPRREPDTSGLVSTDLVRVYLNTIGKTALLTAEQEVELAKRIEAGLYADRLLDGEARPLPRPQARLQGPRHRRQGRQGAPAGGQPPARRLRGQALHRPRHDVPGPDPGGQRRPDPRRREVRLHQGLQVLDLRHLVDPAGDHPGDGRLRAHHPAARPPGRAGQQGGPHPPAHAPGAGARAHRRGARSRAGPARGPDRRAARVQPRPGQPRPDRRRRRGVPPR